MTREERRELQAANRHAGKTSGPSARGVAVVVGSIVFALIAAVGFAHISEQQAETEALAAAQQAEKQAETEALAAAQQAEKQAETEALAAAQQAEKQAETEALAAAQQAEAVARIAEQQAGCVDAVDAIGDLKGITFLTASDQHGEWAASRMPGTLKGIYSGRDPVYDTGVVLIYRIACAEFEGETYAWLIGRDPSTL